MRFFFLLSIILILFSCGSQKTDVVETDINKSTSPTQEKITTQPAQATTSSFEKIFKSDEEWKKELNEQEYHVLREKGTERPGTGDLLKNKEEGIYTCRGCQLPLFDSNTKFESGTGWPSYFQPISKENVVEEIDNTYGMKRVEVLCGRCQGHLGHVFEDGPKPTGLRYCINSVSLDFIKKK